MRISTIRQGTDLCRPRFVLFNDGAPKFLFCIHPFDNFLVIDICSVTFSQSASKCTRLWPAFLADTVFSHSSVTISLGSILTVEKQCYDEAFERLSTLDVRFSSNLKISLCPNSVSPNLLDIRFWILFVISSKSRSERHGILSTEGLEISLSS